MQVVAACTWISVREPQERVKRVRLRLWGRLLPVWLRRLPLLCVAPMLLLLLTELLLLMLLPLLFKPLLHLLQRLLLLLLLLARGRQLILRCRMECLCCVACTRLSTGEAIKLRRECLEAVELPTLPWKSRGRRCSLQSRQAGS